MNNAFFRLMSFVNHTCLKPAVLLVGVFVFLVAGTSHVQAQQVNAYLSADSVKVGDRFTLTLVAQHRAGVGPSFPGPDAGAELYGDLEVLSVIGGGGHAQPGGPDGARIDSLMYEVTTFAVDTAFVPSIPVFFIIGQDTSFFASYPIELPVISLVPEDAEGIKDLAPIADFPLSPWPFVWAFLGLLALGALLYYFWKRKPEPEPERVVAPPPAPMLSPLEEALKRLKGLEDKTDLQDENQVKPYYVELTETLRVYFSRRLDLHAMESTSYELLMAMKKMAKGNKISRDTVELTRRILGVADLVKFADRYPSQEVSGQAIRETRKVFESVEKYLHKTTAAPEEPAETVVETAKSAETTETSETAEKAPEPPETEQVKADS